MLPYRYSVYAYGSHHNKFNCITVEDFYSLVPGFVTNIFVFSVLLGKMMLVTAKQSSSTASFLTNAVKVFRLFQFNGVIGEVPGRLPSWFSSYSGSIGGGVSRLSCPVLTTMASAASSSSSSSSSTGAPSGSSVPSVVKRIKYIHAMIQKTSHMLHAGMRARSDENNGN